MSVNNNAINGLIDTTATATVDDVLFNFDLLIKSDELNVNSLNDPRLKFLLNKLDKQNFLKKLRSTLILIENLMQTSNLDDLCVSFNGGKDCCVVLYLVYKVALKLNLLGITNNNNNNSAKLNVLIMELRPQFNELKLFVNDLLDKYYLKENLNIILYNDHKKSMKQTLCDFKSAKSNVKYIFMGTRRSDSEYYKNMNELAPTDADWPQFIRVNPILDWNYSELWYFIIRLNIPYCSLYDLGYTSLGSPENTVQNKSLIIKEQSNQTIRYHPAYMLDNDYNERNSRI